MHCGQPDYDSRWDGVAFRRVAVMIEGNRAELLPGETRIFIIHSAACLRRTARVTAELFHSGASGT